MPRRRHDAADDPVVPPGPSTIDLHSHTLRSDGVLEPPALVSAAAAAGVRLLAITDHDDLSAYRELTRRRGRPARRAGSTLLPGRRDQLPHDAPCPSSGRASSTCSGSASTRPTTALEAALAGQRRRRRMRFERTLDRLREIGLSVDDVAAKLDPAEIASLGRPTVARLLMAKGHVTSVEDGFAR